MEKVGRTAEEGGKKGKTFITYLKDVKKISINDNMKLVQVICVIILFIHERISVQ